MAIGKRDDSEAVRITTAAASRREDFDARVRGYLISMGIRFFCFVGAVAVGPGWLRWVLMAGAVFLPYVAVVMANAVRSTKEEPLTLGVPAREVGGNEQRRPLAPPPVDSPRSDV